MSTDVGTDVSEEAPESSLSAEIAPAGTEVPGPGEDRGENPPGSEDALRRGNWVSRIARRLGLALMPTHLTERLAELVRTGLTRPHSETLDAEALEAIRQLSEAIRKVENQVSRVGKEQFKANTLAETRQKSLDRLLEQQQETAAMEERYQRELSQLRERLVDARDTGRSDVIRGLFPALDGLREALGSGERLMEQRRLSRVPPEPPRGLLPRLLAAKEALFGTPPPPPPPEDVVPATAAEAWLRGMEIVQERLLQALAEHGVSPIATAGAAFDPHRHVAVDTVTDAAQLPGTVVSESRRGYVQRDRVLRYAEVVVVRGSSDPAPIGSHPNGSASAVSDIPESVLPESAHSDDPETAGRPLPSTPAEN